MRCSTCLYFVGLFKLCGHIVAPYVNGIRKGLKGHGHNIISAYSRESVNSVRMVKSTCTLYTARLEYHTIAIKIDYTCTYTEKYPDPNDVTVTL